MREPLTDDQCACYVCLEPFGDGEQAGQLSGCWSTKGSATPEQYQVLLCRSCFLRIISDLSRDRMLTGLFNADADDFRRENFGRVANLGDS